VSAQDTVKCAVFLAQGELYSGHDTRLLSAVWVYGAICAAHLIVEGVARWAAGARRSTGPTSAKAWLAELHHMRLCDDDMTSWV
jgi:hypothetical protein